MFLIDPLVKIKETINITVPHPPVPWHRAGQNRMTGMTFMHADDRKWQNIVKSYAIQVRPYEAPTCPVMLSVRFLLPRPQYHKPNEKYFHIKKPDLDNLVKNIKDAMNKSMYKDDSQIFAEGLSKEFSDNPSVIISLHYIAASPQENSFLFTLE